MLRLIKNALFYTGVSKEDYDRVKPDINRVNRTMVIVFSSLAAVLIGVMCVLSFIVSSTTQNRIVYTEGFLGSLILFLVSFFYAKRNSWIVVPLVYVSFSLFFLYGIFIGTVTNPTQQTVTFMVLLVFMPVLFCDRPIRMIFFMSLYVLLFIWLCYRNKTGAVLSTDVMDSIIYGVLGATSGGIINHIKVRSYVLEYKLQDASRMDQLTHMNNRNSFEEDLSKLPDLCKTSLACIYVDVNGLHELNDTKGHKMGDLMLQYIAKQIKECFGSEFTYRIGGDEFVMFAPDTKEKTIVSQLMRMNTLIEKESYHIAYGFTLVNAGEINIEQLLKSAESKMYEDKELYYKNTNKDRRRRV